MNMAIYPYRDPIPRFSELGANIHPICKGKKENQNVCQNHLQN